MTKSGTGKSFHAPERVVERGRGCWNCTHFENENLSKQHYASQIQKEKINALPAVTRLVDNDASIHDVARKAAEFMQNGHTMEQATNMALAAIGAKNPGILHAVAEARRTDARFQIFAAHVQRGEIGMCLRGGSGTDFVHFGYLCDKWSGKEGAHVATDGHAPDKLPEELIKELDEKAQKA